jgi:transposase-like protein
MFKGRHFDRSVILLCIRWYLAYNLSLRDLEEMMAERCISVDHATIHRWFVRYSPELLKRFNARKRAVTARWHVDETYIRVRGQWRYLYRAIDSNGDTVEFWFSERRNLAAAKQFLSKALKRHGRPERIVIDGSQTNREVILSSDTTNRLQDRSRRKLKLIRIRQSAYLNNRIEQDHRAIKRRARPMLGFKSMNSAQRCAGWHRNGPHDAKGTGEIRLHSATVARRAVQASHRISEYEPRSDLSVRIQQLRQSHAGS